MALGILFFGLISLLIVIDNVTAFSTAMPIIANMAAPLAVIITLISVCVWRPRAED